jgi:hypothetical protein
MGGPQTCAVVPVQKLTKCVTKVPNCCSGLIKIQSSAKKSLVLTWYVSVDIDVDRATELAIRNAKHPHLFGVLSFLAIQKSNPNKMMKFRTTQIKSQGNLL